MNHSNRLVAVGLVVALAGGAWAREHGAMSPSPDGDTRRPLPLTAMMAAHQKANMREHLAAVERIVGAIARDDMPGVEKASSALGFSESMGQMCEHLGAAAPGFTPMALQFHRTADGIAVAARGGDRNAVLTALDTTLQACVGCHAAYRQEIVDQATWDRLAAEAGAAQGAAHGH